ncbi:MAG: glycosyltransferase family 4 protein [Candidatus Edwardsbacteria bacterium]|nr:glycosyltransferase family 4 protein [Candidatus Edwardsbacteria bacterium]
MRVAVWYNLPSGGAKKALYYQIKYLLERKHYVEVWCPSIANRSFMSLADIVNENVSYIKWPSGSGKSPLGQINKYLNIGKKIKLLEEHTKEVAREINERKFDVLLAHGDQYLASPSIARYVKIPSILYLQEPNRQLYEASLSGGQNSARKHKSMFGFLQNIFRSHGYQMKAKREFCNAVAFNRILVNSYYSRESVLRAYGIDPFVCYLGVDTGKFKPVCNSVLSKKIIGVGSITKSKNIEFIIKALSLIRGNNISLTWIGNFADEVYLKKIIAYAKSLSVDLRIMVDLAEEELISEIGSSHLMVYSPRLEPFGFVTLEANACGIPVVAVAEGGVRETVRDGINGYLCSNDPEDMAEKVQLLFEEANTYKSLCHNCRNYVEDNWTWNKSINELEKHLQLVTK